MDIASEALTRVCTLGGDWNGFVEGANDFNDSEVFESFEVFKAMVSASITATPYIHYDGDHERVRLVTDDDSSQDSGVEVLRMTVPNDEVLRSWYGEELDRRDFSK